MNFLSLSLRGNETELTFLKNILLRCTQNVKCYDENDHDHHKMTNPSNQNNPRTGDQETRFLQTLCILVSVIVKSQDFGPVRHELEFCFCRLLTL